jgi:ribosomal protein S18 acetylase RimI-like enzyme
MCEFDADWLWVEADNKEAVALYTGLGFKIAEKDGNYYKMYHE